MQASRFVRRAITLTIALAVVLIIVPGLLLAAVDTGYGHPLLVRFLAMRLGRPLEVKGTLTAHLLSLHPEMTAGDVIIGNPPWMPAGVTAEIGSVTVALALPGVTETSGIARLAMEKATLHLQREASGHANWQRNDPDKPRPRRNSWIIRDLSVADAHVVLADDFRHRQFVGSVSADTLDDPGSARALRIHGTGQLNGRAVSFRLTGDSLISASHDHPYHFTLVERSSGSHLEARGSLPRPFDFTVVDASVDAAGPDLKDLYFLTGARLLDTGPYHLSARASRRGKHTEYRDLVVVSGRSDIHGDASIDYSRPRRRMELHLDSRALYLADLGLRAAGRAAEPASPLLLSNAAFSPERMRADDAALKFRAQTVAVGRVQLHDVSLNATIDGGVLRVKPFLAEYANGRIEARLKLDATRKVPAADMELKIKDLELGELPYKDPDAAPVEGPLQARVSLAGGGNSLHQMAASAHGTVQAQLPHGAIRASLAELAGGIDLRGLGLVLAHDQREVPIRCATATLKAEAGTLTAQNLVADTDPSLITGEGQIHMDTEALDLVIQGHAKSLRVFRLRAPVLVQGTLAHPYIHLEKGHAVPLLVERGKARDADCAELLAWDG